MNKLTVIVNEVNYQITALDSAGMGMIARWFNLYALSDEEILNKAYQFPNNLEVTTVK